MIDNLITGILSSVATLIGSYFIFKQSDKGNQLKYITDERRKWREKIRELSVEFLTTELSSNVDNQYHQNLMLLKKIRNNVAVNLNPADDDDNFILCLMNCYIKSNCDLTKEIIREKLRLAFALLLKHDWERVKNEAKMRGHSIKFLLISFSLLIVTFIYIHFGYLPENINLKLDGNQVSVFHEYNYFGILESIFFVFLTVLIYNVFDFLVYYFKFRVENSYAKKKKNECFFYKYFGLILKTRKSVSEDIDLKNICCLKNKKD